MALRVWLPLNGNIKNQGLGPQPVNDGTLTYDNGKIGQCRKTGGAKFTANQSTQIFNDNGFTYCAWIYVPGEAGGAIGSPNCFFGRDGAPRIYAIFQYPKVDDLHLSWTQYNDDKSSSIYKAGIQCNDFFEVKTWVHVAVTYEPGKITVYKNGIQYATTTGTPTWSTQPGGYAYETWALTNTPNAYFNDIRVYDECLSQKQIKEISKGLVAHYKLTGVGANPNLLVDAGNRSKWTYESCTRVNDADSKVIGFSVSSANQRIYLGVTNVWNSGQKYTYSFDAKASVNDAQLDASRSIADFGPNHYLTTEWRHYSGKISSTATADTGTLSIRGKTANVTYYLKNIKLENGEEETNYIPNINDIEYTTLGYENDICTDVSGNGYLATKSGTLTFNNDSPRYEGSTTFTSGLVNSPACAVLANSKDFSINGWFYRTGGATITYYASAENYNTSVDLEGSRYFVYGSNGTAYVGNWTSTANTWQMVTLVHNSVAKTLSLYVNGNYISQVATSGDVYANNTLNIGGRQGSANFAGSISDFRIYATALSADEILTMYKNSGIIDNKGNVYAYEFKEE